MRKVFIALSARGLAIFLARCVDSNESDVPNDNK